MSAAASSAWVSTPTRRTRRGRPGPDGGGAPPSAARGVAAHCRTLIERAGPSCVAVKPQLACFERLGAPGWSALAEVCEAAREAGC